MALIDRLAATCEPRKTTAEEFFRTHDGLLDEVRLASRTYGMTQIHRLLVDEYGWQLDVETLRRYVGQK